MRGSGAVALLVGARCFVEAVTFSAVASIAHAVTAGRDPVPVVPTFFMLFGAALLLVTLLREIGGERRSGTIIVVALGLAAVWGLSLPMKDHDGLATLSRVVLFGLLGEAYLWRIVSIARGSTRWTDARNAMPYAGFAIAIAVLMPGPIDRTPFAGLALLAVAAAGLALSLARTTEELALARGTQGTLRTTSATSAMVVVGVIAVIAAALVPSVQDALGAFGTFLGPIAGRIFYLLILPFALLAGYLVELLRPLISGHLDRPPILNPTTPEQDELMLRQIEQTRPYVFGAVELLVVAIAVIVALVLFDRMLRERRLDLPEGVSLERESASGISLMDTLRGLRPARVAARTRPRDDGTTSAAIRVLYWRFLALADARGMGWRSAPETPGEHYARVSSAASEWRAGAPIVRAFEDLRYGEADPTADMVRDARDALRTLEALPRRS
ncbi:MAG TPA: DUF4129 domain-containing protein [Candidatus Limnocylindrales bacterium]|nr:DUF4129 domain-containing protein [Candidatus Limnocylindrales bacterium]